MTEVKQEGVKAGSWTAAGKYALLYGQLPSTFTTFVRSCVKDSQENNNQYSKSSVFEASRFLKSPSMTAPLYFLSTLLFPEEVESADYISAKDFLNWYRPLDLAVIFSMVYVCRRAERMVNEQDWGFLVEPLTLRCELGACVGHSMENIGISMGLLSGTLRSLGLATFLIHDEKGFGQYRRQLKTSNQAFDLGHENERWGCDHPQVCSSILINFGFSSQFAHEVYDGLISGWDGAPANKTASFKTKIVECWTDALMKTGQQPNITHSGDYYPKEKDLGRLKMQAGKIVSGNLCRWITKKKEDVSPELTPKLFKS